jgi:hypothetical protein
MAEIRPPGGKIRFWKNFCHPTTKWLMERSGTDRRFAAFLTRNCREPAPAQRIWTSRKAAAAPALTMIKIGLIATISFAPASQ